MKFTTYYFKEAEIYHTPTEKNRVILTTPTKVDIPDEFKNKRIVTLAHGDDLYFSYIFNDDEPLPYCFIMGDHKNPLSMGVERDHGSVVMTYNSYFNEHKVPIKYGGEVKITPPFNDYVNNYNPLDDENIFTDFENESSKYISIGLGANDPQLTLKS